MNNLVKKIIINVICIYMYMYLCICIYVILFIDYNLEDIDEDFYKFVNFDFFDGSSEESLLSSDSFDLFF